MTKLDHEALIAHIRACANGTDLLQDGAFQMSARRTIRKALNDAADALSSLPAQAVKALDDDQIMEIIRECFPWRTEAKIYDLLTHEKSPPMIPQATYDVPSYRAAKFVAAIETRIRSALAPSQPAAVGVTDEMVEAIVQAVRPYTHRTLFLEEHRDLVRAALRSAP